MTKHFDFNLLFWMVKILTSHVTVIVWNSRQKVYISWPQIRRCCFKLCSQFWEEWLAGAGQTNENIKVTDYCIKAPLTQIFVFSEDDRKTKISPLTFKMTKSMVCIEFKSWQKVNSLIWEFWIKELPNNFKCLLRSWSFSNNTSIEITKCFW